MGEILKNNAKLSIPLYVTTDIKFGEDDETTTGDLYGDWMVDSDTIHESIENIIDVLRGDKDE